MFLSFMPRTCVAVMGEARQPNWKCNRRICCRATTITVNGFVFTFVLFVPFVVNGL
jgi:hypothetical protein